MYAATTPIRALAPKDAWQMRNHLAGPPFRDGGVHCAQLYTASEHGIDAASIAGADIFFDTEAAFDNEEFDIRPQLDNATRALRAL